MRKLILIVAIALTASAADNPFTGTWKLSAAKSKYSPGPAPQSQTVTITPDNQVTNQVTIEGTDGDGKAVKWSYIAVNGKQAAITGMGANSSVIEKRMRNRVTHSWSMEGKKSTGRGTISEDGKTLNYRIKGTGMDGKPMNNVEVFEKQ